MDRIFLFLALITSWWAVCITVSLILQDWKFGMQETGKMRMGMFMDIAACAFWAIFYYYHTKN